jgi:hypothetical protein
MTEVERGARELAACELNGVVAGRGVVATVTNAIAVVETAIMLGVNLGLGALSGSGGHAPKSTWL